MVGKDKNLYYGFYERDVLRVARHAKLRGRFEIGLRRDDMGREKIDPRFKIEAYWDF